MSKSITAIQIVNTLSLFWVFYLTAFTVVAQKLPNKQDISLHAPSNIKVDGKSTEWNDEFQAYNHATEIFYSIANDDKILYLIIKATNPDIINKIYRGGITFKLNKLGKKNKKDDVAITYPVFDQTNQFYVNLTNKPKLISGSIASKARVDSFMNANNKLMTDKSKFIKVIGVEGLDTLISVYNEDGIRAMALFDDRMGYTCEIGISLKILKLFIDENLKIAYSIQLNAVNGLKYDNINKTETIGPNGKTIIHIDLGRTMNLSQLNAHLQTVNSITDFSGTYTLATKP